jgi:hypothetical protein
VLGGWSTSIDGLSSVPGDVQRSVARVSKQRAWASAEAIFILLSDALVQAHLFSTEL